jgi:hypothetical protein
MKTLASSPPLPACRPPPISAGPAASTTVT